MINHPAQIVIVGHQYKKNPLVREKSVNMVDLSVLVFVENFGLSGKPRSKWTVQLLFERSNLFNNSQGGQRGQSFLKLRYTPSIAIEERKITYNIHREAGVEQTLGSWVTKALHTCYLPRGILTVVTQTMLRVLLQKRKKKISPVICCLVNNNFFGLEKKLYLWGSETFSN